MRKEPTQNYGSDFDDLGPDQYDKFMPGHTVHSPKNDQIKQTFIVRCQKNPAAEESDFFFSDSVRYTVNYKSPNGIIAYTAQSKQPFSQPAAASHDPKAEFEDNIVFEVVTEYNTITKHNNDDPFASLGFVDPYAPRPQLFRPSKCNDPESRTVFPDGGETLSDPEPPILQITSLKGKTSIKIYLSAIILALKDVVEYYPGRETLNEAETASIDAPYAMIIHHWEELNAYRKKRGPRFDFETYCAQEQSAFHDLGLLLDYVGSTFMQSVEDEKARHVKGKATWDMLWLLYRPSRDVIATDSADARARQCRRGQIVQSVTGGPYEGERSPYTVTLRALDFDGDYLCWKKNDKCIPYFEGEINITDLEIVPVYYQTSNGHDDISPYQQLVRKGKRFHTMTSSCCRQHQGKRLELPYTELDGLVMVDTKKYLLPFRKRGKPNDGRTVTTTTIVNCSCTVCSSNRGSAHTRHKFAGYDAIDPHKQKSLTDHQYFLCPTTVRAFHFKCRKWHLLDIDNLSTPTFKTDMIDTLVMAPGQIKMLKALSKNFMRQDVETSAHNMWSADFVEGKGSSQIFLLHGKPGVGKTYTAECIAEHTRRPLMTLTCADIGTDAEEVESNLEKHFATARNWGAILLIDEADVYMEKRAATDLIRNSLVASFLRALETYDGILFLTTNRVGAFDDAFVSRIHVKLYYPPLKDSDRKKIWGSFMDKLARERKDMRVTRDAKDVIDSKTIRLLEFNGREIRNAFQTAVALAEYEAKKDEEGRIVVDERHILQVADMSKDFKCYLDDLHEGDEGKRAIRKRERLDNFVAEDL